MNLVSIEEDQVAAVNQVISNYFEHSIAKASEIDPSYRQLWEIMYGLIRSGGKRLRPKMTMMSYQAFGGTDNESIVPVAAAQELLHFSLLIHDDVIDRDYMRYGTENVAGKYRQLYSRFLPDEFSTTHYAHSAAILAGDLMLSGAHQLIASSKLDSDKIQIAQQLLSRGIFEVAGGELLDTESSFVPYEHGDALNIALYKTAGYSFKVPLKMGASMAGATQEDLEKLDRLSVALGIAFQLVDDILGVFGNEDITGKSTTSDIVEGKRTYMVEQAMSAMSPEELEKFERIFGNPDATANEINEVRNMLVSSGAKSVTELVVQKYTKEAYNVLDTIQLSAEHRNEFEKLISQVTERSY